MVERCMRSSHIMDDSRSYSLYIHAAPFFPFQPFLAKVELIIINPTIVTFLQHSRRSL